MSDSLDVIVVDDEPEVCEIISMIIKSFYTWGDVLSFTDPDEAIACCLKKENGVAVFVLDVFMESRSGFSLLDEIADKFPMAYEDAVMITGNASDDVVNMCIASDITHLLEKPVRPYALQLAVRSIVSKYLNFAKRLLQDQEFAENISGFGSIL